MEIGNHKHECSGPVWTMANGQFLAETLRPSRYRVGILPAKHHEYFRNTRTIISPLSPIRYL